MKLQLESVRFMDTINTATKGETGWLHANDGWDLSLDGGIVTAKRKDVVECIPVTNVRQMRPAKPAMPVELPKAEQKPLAAALVGASSGPNDNLSVEGRAFAGLEIDREAFLAQAASKPKGKTKR